ncbi:MAG: DNA internalization-related competence protein ComEC/Rec2 [Acholeplasmatales bacterium]|nr:DNA internalization-related competence protein ComEC/Rec2 [Acholeplasmatales bacterium]
MRLLNLLKKKPFCNDLHYFLIAIVLLMIGLKYNILLILFFIYLVFIIKKTNLLLPISILLLFIIAHVSTLKIIRTINQKTTYNGYILDVIDDNTYIFQSGIIKLRLNDYEHNLKPGDVLTVDVEIRSSEKDYSNDFDYTNYLYTEGISYSGKVIKKEYIKKGFSIYSLKYMYKSYLKDHLSDESYPYVMTMVFGDNLLESNIKEGYSILGISHILAISGLHIIFLFKIILFIFLKLFHYYKSDIPLLIISLFVLFIGLPTTSLRALLFLIIGSINKKGNIHYTKLDILSISFIILMLMNPYNFYSIGFILSFLVSFILIFKNDLIKTKNKVLNTYLSYILIYFVTLPFVIKITGKISIFSIILSPILSNLIYVLLPVSYLLSIFPILDIVLKYIFIFINNYIEGISKIAPLIHIKTLNIYLMIIYYAILIGILYSFSNKKIPYIKILALSSYILILVMFKYLNPISSVTFISVGDGDSALIRLPFSQGVLLVDAYNSYDYLKTEGISKIDYLLLTHSDDDHTGDYKKILDNINVSYIIYPKYDNRFKELLKDYDNKIEVKSDTNLKFKNTNIKILGPVMDNETPNNNSIVFKIDIFNKTFLFTGDMEEKEENDLILKYGKELKSDVIKVAHHGSNTSSADNLLKLVQPTYSVISVGKYNKYGHPHVEVLNRLKEYSKTYLTSNNGNITFNLFNNNLWITTYR